MDNFAELWKHVNFTPNYGLALSGFDIGLSLLV